jgi:hypothetical protein
MSAIAPSMATSPWSPRFPRRSNIRNHGVPARSIASEMATPSLLHQPSSASSTLQCGICRSLLRRKLRGERSVLSGGDPRCKIAIFMGQAGPGIALKHSSALDGQRNPSSEGGRRDGDLRFHPAVRITSEHPLGKNGQRCERARSGCAVRKDPQTIGAPRSCRVPP